MVKGMKMKVTKKDYSEGKIPCVAIGNSASYRMFINDTSDRCWKHRMHTLLKSNVEEFTKLWGKQDWCWKGSEYRYHVWVREFKGQTFIVLTSKGKGTCVEMVSKKDWSAIEEDAEVILDFMKGLYKDLKKLA